MELVFLKSVKNSIFCAHLQDFFIYLTHLDCWIVYNISGVSGQTIPSWRRHFKLRYQSRPLLGVWSGVWSSIWVWPRVRSCKCVWTSFWSRFWPCDCPWSKRTSNVQSWLLAVARPSKIDSGWLAPQIIELVYYVTNLARNWGSCPEVGVLVIGCRRNKGNFRYPQTLLISIYSFLQVCCPIWILRKRRPKLAPSGFTLSKVCIEICDKLLRYYSRGERGIKLKII